MKNLIKKIFFISSIFITANVLCANPIFFVNSARDAMDDSKKVYNNSLSSLSNAASVNNDVQFELNRLQGAYNSIKSELFNHTHSLEYQSKEILNIKTSLDETKKSLANIKENMEKVTGYFPIGEARLKFGDKLCQEALDLVDKNPGDNHQDRKYIESVIQRYMTVKDAFKRAQEFSVSKLIDLSVANPRLEGIESTLKMALDFNDKFVNSNKENNSAFDSLNSSMESANNFYEKMLMQSSDNRMKANQAFTRLNQQHAELVIFLQNEFLKSEKFQNVILKASINSLMSTDRIVNVGNKIITMSGAMSHLEALADEESVSSNKLARRSAVAREDSVGSGVARPAEVAPKTAREEVLAYAVKLRDLTAELAEFSNVLVRMTTESGDTLDALQNIEYNAGDFLRNNISTFSMSQQLVSTIESFKNTLKVNEAQSQIRLGQFDKFIKSFEKELAKSMKLCDDVAEHIKEARAGL